MKTLDDHFQEIFSQLDLETCQLFLEIFNQRLKELNEQTNLQKDSGASR